MKRIVAIVLIVLSGCTVSPVPTPPPVATVTASATFTPAPPSATVVEPTAPPGATLTPRPTSTAYPTATEYPPAPTYTPRPTATPYPSPTATAMTPQRVPRARVLPVGVASYSDGVCWPKYYYSESSGHETRITEDVAGFRMCVAMVGAGQRKALK